MNPRVPVVLLSLAFVAVVLHSVKQPGVVTPSLPEDRQLPSAPVASTVPPAGTPLSRETVDEIMRVSGETRFQAGFARMARDLDVRDLPELLDVLGEESKAKRHPERRLLAARAMTEERCARWFPLEVLRRTDPRSPFNEGRGALIALRVLLVQDQATALSEFRRLTGPDCQWMAGRWSERRYFDSQPFLSGFLAELATLDPALAKGEVLRMNGQSTEILRHAGDMLRVWTAKDPEGARAFLKPFEEHFWHHVLVCPFWEILYLQHPVLAAQWMEEVPPSSRDSVVRFLFQYRKVEDLANTLLLAKRVGTNMAWAQCASHWRLAGKNLDELGALLQEAPVGARKDMLVAYYTGDHENVLREPSEITKLCQFLEPKYKHELLLRLVRAQFTELPIERGLKACLMAEDASLLFHRTRIDEPHFIVEFLLDEDPLETLDWLWGGLSNDGRMALAAYWPVDHARDSAMALMANQDPVRQALGKRLAERWFSLEPLEAWPLLANLMPGWLAEQAQMTKLAAAAAEKGVGIDGLLDKLPDQTRQIARANLLSLKLKQGANADDAEMALRQLQDANPAPTPDTIVGMAEGLGKLRSPKVDEIILMLPPVDPRRAKLLAKRGLFHFSENRVKQAVQTWRLAGNPEAVLDGMGYDIFEKKDWQSLAEVLDFVAQIPALDQRISQLKERVIHNLAVKMVHANFVQSLKLARESSSPEIRSSLWANAPGVVKTEAQLEQLQREAALAGIDKDPDFSYRLAGIGNRLDPTKVLRQAMLAWDDRGSHHWREAGGRLVEESPVRALRFAINNAGTEVSVWLFRKLIDELSKTEPEWVFPATLEWQRVFPRQSLAVEVLRRWAEMDPASAARAAAQLPSGAVRVEAFAAVLVSWYDKAPGEATAWCKGLDDPLAKSEADAALITSIMRADPEAAAKSYLQMPIEHPKIVEEDVRELVYHLANLSYADAAGFLLTFAGRLHPNDDAGQRALEKTIEKFWSRTIRTWYDADASALRGFLDTLPLGEVGNRFRELASRSMMPTDMRPEEFLTDARVRYRAIADAEGIEAMAGKVKALSDGPDQEAALQAAFEIALRDNRFAVLKDLRLADPVGDIYAHALRAYLFPNSGWTSSSVIGMVNSLPAPEAEEVRLDMLGVLGWKWMGDPWRCGDLFGLMAITTDDAARRLYQVFQRQVDSEPLHLLALAEARTLKDGEIPLALRQLKSHNEALLRGDAVAAMNSALQLPQPWFDHLPVLMISRMTAGDMERTLKVLPEDARVRLEGIRALLAPLRP